MAFVVHSKTPYLGTEVDAQISFPSESARLRPVVLFPIPGTVAVITEPPIDPEFGVIAVSFGMRVISLATVSFPSGRPTSKKTLFDLRTRSVELIMVNTALVASTDLVVCLAAPTKNST